MRRWWRSLRCLNGYSMNKKGFIEVLQSGSEEEILKYLQEDDSFQIFKTHHLKLGFKIGRIDLNVLANWLVKESKKLGAAKVVNNFENFLKTESIKGIEILAITGISVEHIIEISKDIHIIPFSELPDSLTLQNLNSCIQRLDLSKKIIDLATAAEAAFQINSDSLSYKLQLRAAWLLGRNKEDRKLIMKLFKNLYDARSNFVHGNINKIDNQVLSDNINEGIKLVSDALWKILKHGKLPDWDNLVIGESF